MLKKIFIAFLIVTSIIFIKVDHVYASETARIGGKDRYATSVQVSEQVPNSDYAVIATGDDFPDALCAAPLAKKYNAPIILAQKNGLDNEALGELKRRQVKNVFITGGYGAVSSNVESQLHGINVNSIERISGRDRFETSSKIAAKLNSDTAFLAIYDDFPDALSASTIAAKNGWTILLTQKDKVDPTIQNYVHNSNIKKTYVLGSNRLIADNVANCFPGYTGDSRIWGSDRFETNEKIMEKFNSQFNFDKVYIATGIDFPDTLVASSLACINGETNPVVLTNRGSFSTSTIKLIRTKKNDIKNFIAIGGSGVVPDAAFKKIHGVTVVLDAGHGGFDSGAVYYGVKEKDINLALTKDIGQILENSGVEVFYTRQDDRALGDTVIHDLAGRADYANSINPDIFLSIHHDAGGSSAEGISTHYSTYRPLVDNTGVYTAPYQDYYVDRDSSPCDAAVKSEKLAEMIGNKLTQLGFSNKGVNDHNLYVTEEVTMPSVLVEAGFMSNLDELRKIEEPSFMKSMAQKIVDGINDYVSYYGLN